MALKQKLGKNYNPTKGNLGHFWLKATNLLENCSTL